MSAATRFDAPLLLGRVVKHPMSDPAAENHMSYRDATSSIEM